MLLTRAEKHQSLFAPAFTPTFARRSSPFFFPSPRSAFLPASALLVYRRPRAPLRFLAAHTALFVTAFNLRCPAFLFRCIFFLASSRHRIPPFFLLKKIAFETARGFILSARTGDAVTFARPHLDLSHPINAGRFAGSTERSAWCYPFTIVPPFGCKICPVMYDESSDA